MSFRRSSAARWRNVCAFVALAFAAISAQAQTLPTAPQVAAQINLGWNLGNTLEAICGETAYGNPVTNQAVINAVKAAGFNAIRIPVSYNCHITDGSTNIPADWMTRVKQVVDMAIGQNMFVIINIHWDGGWLQDHVTEADRIPVNARQQALWTQIATTFRTYDQHLLFAGTNEVHANFSTPTATEISVQQSYNQTFVNAVRATGGNNSSRSLVVQTYNTNVQHGLALFTLPTDSAVNRLMVEVHYYDPYSFTLNPTGSCNVWGSRFPDSGSECNWAYEPWIDAEFAKVRAKWVDQGIPVILGEYGVETRPGKNLEARAYWNEYVNRIAALNGIKTFYWDNGSSNAAQTFRIFDRNTGAIVDQQVLDAILLGSGIGDPSRMFTLTTQVNGMGTVSRSPTGTSFPGGTDVTLTATPTAGNDFVGWTGDASGSVNPKVVRILANTTVTANFVPTGTGGSGTILRESWTGINGLAVADLTSNPNYPNNPTGSEQLTSFEGPTNVGDQYGSRVRGYIHPPITGAYVFWIASDDASNLLLSTNDSPANATRIAFVTEWTDSRQWTKFPSQRSASINLVGGQKYYIEAIHKEATGGDNLAVSWQGPGFNQAVIPGNFLSPFVVTGGGPFALTVTRAGTGTGTVTSAPAGVNCGTTCSATFTNGTSVTLTAAAAAGSTFAGWSGSGCTGTATCTVSMTAARSVTATFNSSAQTFALTVTKNGTGAGTVTSNTGGINCGTVCSANIAGGTNVTLTAAASAGSVFASWGGACSGTALTCTVSMTAARAVTATFNTSPTFALAITKMGTGAGTVTSNPAGINCGTTCSANFATNTSVTLTAAAAAGSTFGGWSGACTGTGTCTTVMSQARNVTATFNSSTPTFPLTVTLAGTGTGTVTSSPTGISCGTTCSANFASTVSVTLTAAVGANSTFAGFSGACTGTTCTVAMSQARAVTATFNTTGGGTTCANPVTFTNNTGNINSGTCFRTSMNIAGWGCSSFDGRTVTVGGQARSCGQMPLTRSADGFYYFAVTAGAFPWATIFAWQ